MADKYQAVGWNGFKLRYDLWIGGAVAAFVIAYSVAAVLSPPTGDSFHPVQIAMRASGAAAFALLTAVLAIGPLARFVPGVAPLLYNRRHAGVMVGLIALVHAALAIGWYYSFSPLNPFVALLASRAPSLAVTAVPFELLGLAALAILLVMAATSHDHWLKVLGAPRWKALHMAVYGAYALLVGHVAFGMLQVERAALYPRMLLGAAGGLALLHLAGALREALADRLADRKGDWLDAGPAADIPEGRAVIIAPAGGERIAVWRHEGRLFALSGVCPHQNGPLGEGRILDGCITCPWHGWQYRPMDGRSPPPFDERVDTYPVRIEAGRALVGAQPLPAGATSEGVLIL